MTEPLSIADETAQLASFLNMGDLQPVLLEARLKEFSAESKDTLIAQVAQTLDPPATSRLLSRLLYLRSDKNANDLAAALIVNLRSPDADVRLVCLYGLQQLAHPALVDFALLSLRDLNDQVLTSVCSILLPVAKQEPRIWKTLENLYKLIQGKPEFYTVNSLLEAHEICPSSITQPLQS